MSTIDQETRNKGIVVSPDDLPWMPLAEGVEFKILHVGDESPTWSLLIRLQPGERLPAHFHLAAGEFLILEGSGHHPTVGDFKTGDYCYEYAGAFHPPSTYHEETTLLMVSHGPCSMLDKDGKLEYVLDAAMLRQQQAGAAA